MNIMLLYSVKMFTWSLHAAADKGAKGKRKRLFTLQLRITGLRCPVRKDYNEIISHYKWSLEILHICQGWIHSSSLCPIKDKYNKTLYDSAWERPELHWAYQNTSINKDVTQQKVVFQDSGLWQMLQKKNEYMLTILHFLMFILTLHLS